MFYLGYDQGKILDTNIALIAQNYRTSTSIDMHLMLAQLKVTYLEFTPQIRPRFRWIYDTNQCIPFTDTHIHELIYHLHRNLSWAVDCTLQPPLLLGLYIASRFSKCNNLVALLYQAPFMNFGSIVLGTTWIKSMIRASIEIFSGIIFLP